MKEEKTIMRQINGIKRCSKGKTYKSIEEFNKDMSTVDRLRSSCKICSHERNKKYWEKNGENFKEKNNERSKEYSKKFIKICLDHYGHKCSIPECGSVEKLCIDHVGGNDGKSPVGGMPFWRWLIKNNFPPGFRTLCMRCNLIDGYLRKHPNIPINGIDDFLLIVNNQKYRQNEMNSVINFLQDWEKISEISMGGGYGI
jgi:hypothetical protein